MLLWRLTLDVGEAGPQGHATLLHRCKGHARSVEALAVSSDRSKVSQLKCHRWEGKPILCAHVCFLQFCSVSWDSFVKIWSTGVYTFVRSKQGIHMMQGELSPDLAIIRWSET